MHLIDELKEVLQRRHRLATDDAGAPADLEVQAAVALLLLEAAYGDEEYVRAEHREIVKGLKHAFGLGKQEVGRLLQRSEEVRPPAVRLSDVADVIRERYDDGQRLEIVKLLWRVVKADGSIAPWEEVFVEGMARAVGISDEIAAEARSQA